MMHDPEKTSRTLEVAGEDLTVVPKKGWSEVFVPLSDGVKLRTLLYIPGKGSAPYPVLFVRTPYAGAEAHFRQQGEWFGAHEYAYVFQFCRGTGGSEGAWIPNEHERADGIASLAWLCAQPWCGPVGVHGVSYMALTGWMVADHLPEKVKTMYLCHYGVDRHRSAYRDGLFRHDILTGWALGNAGLPEGKEFTSLYLAACRYRPHVEADEQVWEKRLDWYREWITHPDPDAPYWQTGVWKTLREMPPKVRVPVCIVAGWFDHHLEGTLLGYQWLSPAIREKSRLVVGAWNHDFQVCVPGHETAHAGLDPQAEMLAWFDALLLGKGRPKTGMSLYRVGADRWEKHDGILKNAAADGVHATSLFFANGEEARIGRLLPSPDTSASVMRYRYDPLDPVPTRGGETVFVTSGERGSREQEAPGYRADVLSFLSEPLTAELELTGAPSVSLTVASDAEDTCFTAVLMEVAPDGTARNVRSGLTTLAYRNGSRVPLMYVPGTRVDLTIPMLPVCWRFPCGSRIRVDISSSNFPEYAAHANLPGLWSHRSATRVAEQSVYLGEGTTAGLTLPGGWHR